MVRKVSKNNYRQFYKEYYGIEFDERFQVHHIDKNRDNNKIYNLLLLPTKVHKRFHFIDSVKTNQEISLFTMCSDSYYKELFNTIDFNVLRNSINKWNKIKEDIDYHLCFDTYDKESLSRYYQLYIDEYHEEN